MKLIFERWNRFVLNEALKEERKNLLKESNEDEPNNIGEIIKLVLYSDFDEEKIRQARSILKNEEIHPGHVIGEMLTHLEKLLRKSIAYKMLSFELDDQIEVIRLSIPAFIDLESSQPDRVIEKFEDDLTEIYEKASGAEIKSGRLGRPIAELTEKYILVLHALWLESIGQTQDSENLGSLDSADQMRQDASRPDSSNISTNRPD